MTASDGLPDGVHPDVVRLDGALVRVGAVMSGVTRSAAGAAVSVEWLLLSPAGVVHVSAGVDGSAASVTVHRGSGVRSPVASAARVAALLGGLPVNDGWWDDLAAHPSAGVRAAVLADCRAPERARSFAALWGG